MTRPAADSIKVTWTGTGTGTMSLGAAVSGFQAFPAALNGHVVSYTIEHQSATEREMGIGTYTSSGTTLTRDLVTFSTAGGTTKVTFSAGTKHVRLTGLAHDVVENRDTVDPGVNDDITAGYIAGRSRWLNTSTEQLFFCVRHATGAAVWQRILDDPTAFGTFISGLSQVATLDQTNDLLVLFDATDSQAKSIRWTGRFESNMDGANYSVTPYTAFGRNRKNVFTAAQNHIIEFPAGLSTTPPVYGAFMAPPANTLTLRRVAASGVSINGVADDAFTWVVPATGLVFWWVIDTNTVWLWGDISLAELDVGGNAITNYRNKKYGALTGAQTLSAANFTAGSKLVHTGAAATYTVPSRLASTDTGVTEELKVRNGGSGAITWSASGVTLLGDTGTLGAGETAVLEWEHDGSTERVEIRATS